MLIIESIRVQYKKLQKGPRYRVIQNTAPVFSWGVRSNQSNNEQVSCRVVLICEKGLLWDSGIIETAEQTVAYLGNPLPMEVRITVLLSVTDRYGNVAEKEDYFFISGLSMYDPCWIAPETDQNSAAVSYQKTIQICKPLKHATLYACGIGYHDITLNNQHIDDSVMEPVFSDYTKTVYFSTYPEFENNLVQGANTLRIEVAEGWRRNYEAHEDKKIHFYGRPQLAAIVHLVYEDGEECTIFADETWQCRKSAIVDTNIFRGEIYDANTAENELLTIIRVPAPGGRYLSAVLEPIVPHEKYSPIMLVHTDENTSLVDFGQNIAGVFELKLPLNMKPGQRITVRCGELYEQDTSISESTMRDARAEDTYIASGDERDLKIWRPRFTYHGFQVVSVKGYPLLKESDIVAVSYYTDIASSSNFHCGSAVANAVHRMCVQTEKANIHGILTDCPQRDERLGWLNDATVRFEETPYNFDISTIFPKVVADIADTQWKDGSIYGTAPELFYGHRPADPVSSSYLIAGWIAFLHTGNKQLLKDYFECFEKWESCILAHSDGFIVNYSYYGDWAAPCYACSSVENASSRTTPGQLMSTGYAYYNAILLAGMAEELGYIDKKIYYNELSLAIKDAILKKWWDDENAILATGSHGCQVFGLWLGIIPENKRAQAAKYLNDDLIKNNLRFTTGNLCTKYLFDVLTEHGYVDTAWKLFTKETYPSFGYMMQNGGTTVWERFEYKSDKLMNSHCHPMYGAVDYWLYAYIAGIKIKSKACNTITVKPHFPENLMFAEAEVETIKGIITVRWMKQWGTLSLFVDIPFGMTAKIYFNGNILDVSSGLTVLTKQVDLEEQYGNKQ